MKSARTPNTAHYSITRSTAPPASNAGTAHSSAYTRFFDVSVTSSYVAFIWADEIPGALTPRKLTVLEREQVVSAQVLVLRDNFHVIFLRVVPLPMT